MWIHPVSKEILYTHSDIRKSFPTTSFPSEISDEDILGVGIILPLIRDKPDNIPANTKLEPKVLEDLSIGWEVVTLTAEEIQDRDAQALRDAKSRRQILVDSIKVTVASGRTFDGDEISQGRMARAIVALQATNTTSTTWVLSNNTVATIPTSELIEALALAGTEQTRVWISPYSTS